MKIQCSLPFFLVTLALLVSGCSKKWTQVIRSGKISTDQFIEKVDLKVRKDLVFVPVTIQGKVYNFLLDTGAPFSISKKLQEKYNFKQVAKSHIVDSDQNRQQVGWVNVSSISIGDVIFTDQVAFIGDFGSNPVIKCLEIDGIVGSNILRQCNWTIDQEINVLTFSKNATGHDHKKCMTIPFSTDQQFNMYINIGLGQAAVKNVLVDYGSNGSVTVSKKVFSMLKEKSIVGSTMTQRGTKQSGIVGEPVDLHREFVYTDSVCIDSSYLRQVMVRTGNTTSIGNQILSRFMVTIDWENRQLHFSPAIDKPEPLNIVGFGLGYSADQGIYVQSIVEPSNAYKAGVRPNMKVLKVDHLNFEGGVRYCDYIFHEFGQEIFLELTDSIGQKAQYRFERTGL
jgi:predicted aspartyl protease